MGALSRWLGLERKEAGKAFWEDAVRWMSHLHEAKSGIAVNPDRALQVSTVLACVMVLANGLSQVPFKIFKPGPGGRGSEPATDHPLYELLSRRPNQRQTSVEFRQTMALHLTLCGSFTAVKMRVQGRLDELIPILPERVEVVDQPDGSLRFRITGKSGSRVELSQKDVWHIQGLSWDGITALDPIRLAREAIGLAIATEEHHARSHRNGARPSGVLSVNDKLVPEKYAELKAWLIAETGKDNMGAPLLIDQGGKWTQISLSGVDAQHLETRRFQVEEICRAFNVRPIMIGHYDKSATYASAEQMFLAHVVHTLSPLYAAIEQSAEVNLLERGDQAFVKFVAQGLLRGAAKDRAEFYAKASGAGGSPAWMTPNEIRALEDLNPLPGGDELPKPPAAASTSNSGA